MERVREHDFWQVMGISTLHSLRGTWQFCCWLKSQEPLRLLKTVTPPCMVTTNCHVNHQTLALHRNQLYIWQEQRLTEITYSKIQIKLKFHFYLSTSTCNKNHSHHVFYRQWFWRRSIGERSDQWENVIPHKGLCESLFMTTTQRNKKT
jgi:hypothetical protein